MPVWQLNFHQGMTKEVMNKDQACMLWSYSSISSTH